MLLFIETSDLSVITTFEQYSATMFSHTYFGENGEDLHVTVRPSNTELLFVYGKEVLQSHICCFGAQA